MSYDNTNRGQMWRSEKQKENDRDFQGSINIEGVEYWLSGWSKKQGDNPNAPSVRFSVQAKEQAHNQGYQQAQQAIQPQQQAPQQHQQAPQQKQNYQQAPQQQQAPMQQAPQQDQFNDDIPF